MSEITVSTLSLLLKQNTITSLSTNTNDMITTNGYFSIAYVIITASAHRGLASLFTIYILINLVSEETTLYLHRNMITTLLLIYL